MGSTIDRIQIAVGSNIKKIRESKGLTQIDVAANSGLEKTALSRIENGRTNITLTTISKLATAMGVPMKDILDF